MKSRALAALALAVVGFGSIPAASAEAAPAPPSVTRISNYFSLPGGGARVTLTGSSLRGTTSVLFGTTPATNVTVVSSSTVTVTVPAHVIGTVGVTVKTTKGTSAVTDQSRFTYHNQAPSGATVKVTTYVPLVSICMSGSTCKSLAVTTSGFASTVTCRVTNSDYGPIMAPWTMGAAATKQTGYSISSSFVEVTCDGVVGRKSPW